MTSTGSRVHFVHQVHSVHRVHVIFALLLVLFSQAALAAGPSPDLTGVAPCANVVVILLDAQRFDSFWGERDGKSVCPFLVDTARHSISFQRAYTPCTWTKPAVASLFTSLDVDTHGVYFSVEGQDPRQASTDVLPSTVEGMATYFRSQGYSTAAIQTNANLTKVQGFDAGFDSFEFHDSPPASWPTGKAIEALQTLKPPYFLYIHYMDPHGPYTPPGAYRTFFGPLPPLSEPDQQALADSGGYVVDAVFNQLGARPERRFARISENGREAFRILYDADCRYMDDELKRLFAQFDAENTLVVVLADHGQEHWDHGSAGHGHTMYDETLHIPLFVQVPGAAAQVVERPVSTLSVLPTLAALAGLDARPQWQGENLLAGPAEARPVFSVSYSSSPNLRVHVEAVIDGNLKLVANRTSKAFELYDLAADPGERHNLATDQPETVQRLDRLLVERLKGNMKHRTAFGAPTSANIPLLLQEELDAIGYVRAEAKSAPKKQLDEETREQLRRLGYME